MSCDNKNVRVRTVDGVTKYYDLNQAGFPEITDPVRIAQIVTEIAEDDNCGTCDVECVESQEWTYALDNTGTRFTDDNTIQVNLSDGTFFVFNQPPTTNWTPQMALWGTEIQAAADAAGLLWFVETRFRNPSNPSSLAGGGGFAGPPSVPVSLALTNMLWRYVNIQICPGQPTPVSAEIIASSDPAQVGVALTTDGPVKGPLQKFFVCRECGVAPVWYLADGVTLATAGQVPDCYEPCGTLALVAEPPEGDCEFQTLIGCDNNNSTLTTDFTPDITRRAKICNGEQIAVDYFQVDPLDPNALIPYTLNGIFVDCATGEPIPLPEQPCAEFNTVDCPPYEIYPKPLTDSGRNLSSQENDLLPFNDTVRNFTPWLPAFINTPPFPIFGFTDVAPGTAITGGFNDGAENVFRTRVFPLGLAQDQIPTCGDGTTASDVEVKIQLQITGNHTVPGVGDDIFIYLMDGANTSPNLLDTIALVGAPLLGTNIYTLSSTVPATNLADLRFALSLQTVESNTRIFNWDVEIFEVGIIVDGCEVDCVRYVHDECASNQRKSANDLLYQIAQNTRPVVEPEAPCSDFLIEKFFQLEETGVAGQFREREWFDTGADRVDPVTMAGSLAILDSFTLVDNIPLPSAAPDTDVTTTNLTLNDTGNATSIVDLQVKDGYIIVDKGFHLRFQGTSERYTGIWLGECCGRPKNIYNHATDNSTPDEGDAFAYIPAGVHYFAVLNLDVNGVNASSTPQASLDGGATFGNISTAPWRLTSGKPTESCLAVKICKDTGDFSNLLTDEAVDKTTLTICPQLCEDKSVLEEIRDLLKAEDSCFCENGCILMDGFDVDRGLVTVGDTTTFLISLDGTLQSTVVHDYLSTSDGINVSSYYPPIISAINAVPGWSISLDTDVLQTAQGKPTWKVEYSGTGASQLVIDKDSGGSVLTLDADGAGNIVGSTNWGVDSFPFRDC